MDAAMPIPSPDHTLQLFGQYGGLIGVIIGMLFIIIILGFVVGAWMQRSRETSLAQALVKQGETIAQSIRDQAQYFVNTIEQIRDDHQEDRNRMLDIIEGRLRQQRIQSIRSGVAKKTQVDSLKAG